jgi:uncharacterized cupin superfamily protein
MAERTNPPDCPHLLRAADIDAMAEQRHVHQFNDRAVRLTRTLGLPTGLSRIGVHLVRLAPGHDSTQHHYHDADEDFIYVLSGQGIARIGEAEYLVGPGDFMGFPAQALSGTPGPAHSLTNPFEVDLVYLMGGERNPVDAVHYPRIRRSMFKAHGTRRWAEWDDLHDL